MIYVSKSESKSSFTDEVVELIVLVTVFIDDDALVGSG